ncbi:glutathione hydrolase 5 proenzyme-like [Polyodon spathula]|uniref:glutathione hydrolase 5 proenzyme-like n=1 Tax=Polyodon spathula TaxID=7913 RepID=UPI001B7EFBB1|nr:glutathione hydrolase 5 proenzyme-like [Polyodon spathula]
MAITRTKACCVVFFTLLFVTVFVALIATLVVKSIRSPKGRGCFRHAAVAADSELCSEIGSDMLYIGGSAVDGAIAALLCTSLMNPQSMGIGGGVIFTVYNADGTVKIINARETVPRNVKPDLLGECPKTFQLMPGSQWMGVPGEIRGYAEAHRLYGKLPWRILFQPAIRLARQGFPIPVTLGMYLGHLSSITNSSLCAVFCDHKGEVLKAGQIIRYPKLADTLELIAEQGPDAFYKGSLVEAMVQDTKSQGGTLTAEDFENFKVKIQDPLLVEMGGYLMYIPPVPAGGAVLSFILKVMEGFGLTPDSLKGENRTLTYHRIVEALKFGNGQKRKTNWSAEEVHNLISEGFANNVRKLIDDDRTHPLQYYTRSPGRDSVGTTHVSVLAEDGSAVSVTSTINQIFGSMVYSPKTGVIFNNELADFCGKNTSILPGEQPPSSVAPLVFVNKSRNSMLVIGGSGGSMITSSTAQVIMNYLWLGYDLKDAIAAPVLHVTSTNEVQFERSFNTTVKEELRAMGHTVTESAHFFNVVNAVSRQRGCIAAVSDTRKMGVAAGY